ncbi:hypothetical protein [Microtetraspora malaysiensis]|uniref:hypothetical protein n=1 Tax=Microtetraspora malaysiensis TaxID=161358 RepID=UPI003D90691E
MTTGSDSVSVRLDAQRQAVQDGLTRLLRLGGDQREDWLDRRQPPPDGRANWWLYLLLVIDRQIGGRPDRQAAWVDLKLWLLRQGSARGIFTPIEIAEKTAYFVAGLRPAGSESAVVLPSADDVVRACLDAIPEDLDHVAVLNERRDLRGLDRTRMLRSRQARILISAAQLHLDEVRDEHLASRLRKWIAVKPRLV